MDLERLAETMKMKYECMKVKHNNEVQKDIKLAIHITKLRETIENVNKSSCFQKLFRKST